MALQAGMVTSKMVLLIGAGLTGSVLLKNSRISDFVSDLSKVFSKHLKEESKENSGENAEVAASLSAQVQRLTHELRQALAGSRSITVVNGASQGSGISASSLAMPVVVVGVVGYGYFWWKGFSWTDVMYVTRRNMTNAVATVSKQLEQVSSAIAATKRHLTSRIDNVSKTLDDSLAVQGIIKDEVFEIRGDVARVGGDIGSVQQIVEGLGVQLDEVQAKQDFTNQGIILLCQFVKKLEEHPVAELTSGLPPLSRGRLDRCSSATVSGVSGLKELQFIADALSKNKSSRNGGNSIQRHSSLSFGQMSGLTGLVS